MTQEQLISDIVDFEMGCLGDRDSLLMFGHLIKSGQVWVLQGYYGRMANALIKSGIITQQGEVQWDMVDEDLL